MEEKRSKGLCFWCDEKYSYGHQCMKKRQLFYLELGEGSKMLEMDREEDVFDWESMKWPQEKERIAEKEEHSTTPRVSVNAMTGIVDYKTMKVTGSVKGKVVQILIDTGSTHNFLDFHTAKRLRCKLKETTAFVVAVADGNSVFCNYVCEGFSWRMQGLDSVADILILPLDGCNVVLGIEWLITLGDIKWNFRELKMEFLLHGKKGFIKRCTTFCYEVYLSGSDEQVVVPTSILVYDVCCSFKVCGGKHITPTSNRENKG